MGAVTEAVNGLLAEGELIADYEILGIAGAGGMGVVYRAKQHSLDRVVALKVVREEVASMPEYRERFLREARLAASVDHPHIVSVFDVVDHAGQLALALQWVDGEDFRSVLVRCGRLAPERAVEIVCQLGSALDAVNRTAGLVHRDVKPANVLIREVDGSEHAYLTDFGLAKPAGTDSHMTQSGWAVGTPGYLSPEQIRGAEPDSRSDLYALGCLLYEALTGRAPFPGDNEMAVRWAHANDPRPLASAAVPGLGQRYDGFIAKALAINPAQRYVSGQAFTEALLAAHRAPRAQPSPVPVNPQFEPTVVGPSTPLPPVVLQPPTAPPVVYQAYTPPPPMPSVPPRGGSPLALILLAVVALAGIAVGALVAAGVFSHPLPTRTVISPASAPRALKRGFSHRRVPSLTTASTAATSPPAQTTSTAPGPPSTSSLLPGSPVTGRDANGYNVGPGCSDDPQASLPGCADSPSAPNGDQVSSCTGGGITVSVYSATTSCRLAAEVYAAYSTDGPLTVPTGRARTRSFLCQTGGPGTTGNTICIAGSGPAERYVRW